MNPGIQNTTRLKGLSCPVTSTSIRPRKYDKNRADEQYRNRTTNSFAVQNHHVGNSKYNIKIFMTQKPGRSTNKQEEIENFDNTLCAFKQNNENVKQDLYRIKKRIFANLSNNISYEWNANWPNSVVLSYQLFSPREMKVYNLWQLYWDNERHPFSQSFNKKSLNSVVKIPNELLLNDFSKIWKSMKPVILDSIMCPGARAEVDKNNNPGTETTICAKTDEKSTKYLECNHNCVNSLIESELVLSLSDSTESIIDEKQLDVFLLEEEFDDDTIILQNMSKNGNMDLVCASQPLSLPAVQPLTINDDFRSDFFSSDQSASSIYSNSSNDYSNDDGFLDSIMNLSSRLGQLITSCKNMNSDLKGISRDMQKKDENIIYMVSNHRLF